MELDSILKSGIENLNLDETVITRLPKNLIDLPNIILYGSAGTGKYTESLKLIKQYSNSELKYSKRLLVSNAKSDMYIKISDIHFEIDMELLGCNAKLLWNDIFYSIIDIVINNDNRGIIICKNFHAINNELLDIFYSYMQNDIFAKYTIRFILLTEAVSFIPSSIITVCQILSCEKFNKTFYKNEFNIGIGNCKNNSIEVNLLNNIKSLRLEDTDLEDFREITVPHAKICDTIIDIIVAPLENVNFGEIRRVVYDILVYNLNIHDCVFYILSSLINRGNIKNSEMINADLLHTTYIFFKYYNNNYRPIYHLENYVLYLIRLVDRDEL